MYLQVELKSLFVEGFENVDVSSRLYRAQKG